VPRHSGAETCWAGGSAPRSLKYGHLPSAQSSSCVRRSTVPRHSGAETCWAGGSAARSLKYGHLPSAQSSSCEEALGGLAALIFVDLHAQVHVLAGMLGEDLRDLALLAHVRLDLVGAVLALDDGDAAEGPALVDVPEGTGGRHELTSGQRGIDMRRRATASQYTKALRLLL
jgi:hypothetical protein